MYKITYTCVLQLGRALLQAYRVEQSQHVREGRKDDSARRYTIVAGPPSIVSRDAPTVTDGRRSVFITTPERFPLDTFRLV